MNSEQLSLALEPILNARKVPMILGAPGVGKSDIIKQKANKAKLKLIDVRLSQCDPVDLNGFPKLSGDKATYVPMDVFPLSTTPIPDGYKGWLLFLDEINSASKAVQAAAYKIVLDRMVGQYSLHDKVYIVCAGNRVEDNAVVQELSSALKSRLITLNLEPDAEAWLKWGYAHNIDSNILGFIDFNKDALHCFDPDSSVNSYACPRTWSMLSDVLRFVPKDKFKETAYTSLIEGCIGNKAQEFISYVECAKFIPKIEDILAGNVSTLEVYKPGVKTTIISYINTHSNMITTEQEASNVYNYIQSFGKEYTMSFLLYAPINNPELLIRFNAFREGFKDMAEWI